MGKRGLAVLAMPPKCAVRDGVELLVLGAAYHGQSQKRIKPSKSGNKKRPTANPNTNTAIRIQMEREDLGLVGSSDIATQ